MSETLETFRYLQEEAVNHTTECLRQQIVNNAWVLDDLAGIAENMAAVRHAFPENEELYQTATAELISALMIISVFSAELFKRPAPVASFTLSAN
jgi:hypothetical protein